MEYITKTQLIKRWSSRLVEQYYPYPTDTKPNPMHKRGAPMRLYDLSMVRRIESTEPFKSEWIEVLRQRINRKNKRCHN